ncbi:MAG TPA: adenylate/guanylate cyclase domain-containing protein [Chthoniobacteraceae bacterium]|nr:adenylate/guanylate cyclase domain-containing protein [Chthoniobacteraceae bacterium]
MRYLKATLICALLALVIALGLYEAGALRGLDRALAGFLGLIAPAQGRHLPAQFAAIILLSFGIAWTTVDLNRTGAKLLVALAALGEILGLTVVLALYGTYFSPFPGLAALLVAFFCGLAFARSPAGKRKRLLEEVFGDRISRATFNKLINSDTPLRFHGEIRAASIVVCEIFNHDELMESLSTEHFVAATNLLLKSGADFLVERGGYLDECAGETLRVIFGAPLADDNHAEVACEAALRLVEELDNVNRECMVRFNQTLDFRIGVNSGEMVCAAYGSNRLGTFSVAGEPVEFARRLCAANTIYGSRILAGSHTLELGAHAVEVRPMELVRTRDERTREEVYELLGMRNTLPDDALQRRDLFWKGIIYYREKLWDDALDHFRAALPSQGIDAPLEFYIRRTEQLRDGLPALEWSRL